jgi:hypothetical protein
MPYRIYVKQKSGETVSGIEIHHGPLPKTGDKVDVKLQSGRIIQARVGIPHSRASRMGGTPVIQVHADEI